MKIIQILTGFIILGLVGRSQNFFYIENKNLTEKYIRDELMRASQYVTKSPLASDYIITASASVQSGTKILNLEITMQDSISFKTLFQTSENYTLDPVNENTRVFLRMTIAGFI